jgi:LPPG:FO 2-phospho-L-lactate transferase
MTRTHVVALSGGIGGAKLALGLSRILPPEHLTLIANTGDDFEHLGLSISPDIDTLTYVLAGLDNLELGWGRRDETWSFMQTLETLGGETWFRLGDRDLALHIERTSRLRAGATLTATTAAIAASLGVAPRILPMSDDPVRTRLRTSEGWLDFQPYFVGLRCAPVVHELAFEGAATARPNPLILETLARPDLRCIVICPSNPFISVDPILAVPGLREAIAAARAPVVAVSPIIAGRAVKGPTAKMMTELGLEVSAATVARHYAPLLDGYIIDAQDAASTAGLSIRITPAQTLMTTLEDRESLARVVLQAADALR